MAALIWHTMMSLDGFVGGPGFPRVELERTTVGDSGPVTDLRFRVVK